MPAPAGLSSADAEQLRVSEALSLYRDKRLRDQRRGGSTFRSITILLQPVSDEELASVSRERLEALISQMSAQAPVHAQRAQAYAAPFFAWALEAGFIQQNPLARIWRERARPP